MPVSLSHTQPLLRKLNNTMLKEIIGSQCTFLIIWDNLNSAFQVGKQWKALKDHFDNGTMAMLIPLYGVEYGEL